MTFEVPGEPRGQGRPRFNRHTGAAYKDSESKAYEAKIVAYYRKTLGNFRWPDDAIIAVDVTAVYAIPKSASKVTAAAMANGDLMPTRKPDIDNVLKAVLDALNGVAYKDDARVVAVSAKKVYGEPRLVIEIKGSV